MQFATLLWLSAALAAAADIPLTPAGIDSGTAKIEVATYKGKSGAIHLTDQGESAAIVRGTDFHNGTIEVDIAAKPGANSPEGSRGFAGLAFRIKDRAHYEAFYIRPTNGRADDQLRRNHSTQYISEPEWPWHKLRQEMPGVYESYVDLEPDVWTHFKIVVKGLRAELYIGSATQPCLIVKDLKKGDSRGPIGLWIGQGTDAHFANLKVTAQD